MTRGLALAVAATFVFASNAAHAQQRVQNAKIVVLDDSEKLRGEPSRPLPASPFGDVIELVALPGETVAIQVVIEPLERLGALRAEISSTSTSTFTLTAYAERFLHVPRPSGNEREPGSLAFSAAAAPPKDAYVGLVADPLVPAPLTIEAGARGALWLDFYVDEAAPAGTHTAKLVVASEQGIVVEREVRFVIGAVKLPYDAGKVITFYDPKTLNARVSADRKAEWSLRKVLHAHRITALTERTTVEGVARDRDALTGGLYSEPGPGRLVPDPVYAIGAYGSFGDPSQGTLRTVEAIDEQLQTMQLRGPLEKFIYAVDEQCKSPRARNWLDLLATSPLKERWLVGVTCGQAPITQAATLVMVPAGSYDPESADAAKRAGKHVWAYNGIRPHAGPMMLDVPASDLRANSWIAARYGIERWFYWESTFYLDDGRGGKGGGEGFDPYVVAETFHNKDGDYAMGDGILVYPGQQRQVGRTPMTSFDEEAFYPSVRLKNLRRGIQDAELIALARAKDPKATEALVRTMIPRALKRVNEREATPWPQNGAAWEEARRELIRIVLGQAPSGRLPTLTSDHQEQEDDLPRAPLRQYVTAAIGILVVSALAGIVTMLALRSRKKKV